MADVAGTVLVTGAAFLRAAVLFVQLLGGLGGCLCRAIFPFFSFLFFFFFSFCSFIARQSSCHCRRFWQQRRIVPCCCCWRDELLRDDERRVRVGVGGRKRQVLRGHFLLEAHPRHHARFTHERGQVLLCAERTGAPRGLHPRVPPDHELALDEPVGVAAESVRRGVEGCLPLRQRRSV